MWTYVRAKNQLSLRWTSILYMTHSIIEVLISIKAFIISIIFSFARASKLTMCRSLTEAKDHVVTCTGIPPEFKQGSCTTYAR